LGILRSFEDYCATAFRSTIRPNVDVGADDVACGPEQIFQILPPSLIGQLQKRLKLSPITERREHTHFQRKAGSQDFGRTSYGMPDEVVVQQ